MEWAIITIYTSECAQMDPNSYLKRQNFIPDAKSVTSKNLRRVGTTPLGSPKVKYRPRTCSSAQRMIPSIEEKRLSFADVTSSGYRPPRFRSTTVRVLLSLSSSSSSSSSPPPPPVHYHQFLQFAAKFLSVMCQIHRFLKI